MNDVRLLPLCGCHRTRLLHPATLLLLLGFVILFGMFAAPAQAQTFSDVGRGDWFYEAVEALAGEEAVGGYGDGTFHPYEPITRAQFAAMIAGVLHLPPGDGTVFSDVRGSDWFAGAVGALYEVGVVQGGEGGVFAPAAAISRQQAASLTMRAVAYRLSLVPPPSAEGEPLAGEGESGSQTGAAVLMTDPAEAAPWLGGFRDRGSIAAVHALAVANAYRAGIVTGFADQRFYPFLDLTRGQAAGVVYEALLLPLTMADESPSAVEAESGYPTLGKGSSGAVVAWMERRLAALSYRPGAIDGVYDAGTTDAVMAFQKVERLERSGKAGDAVQRRLASAVAPSPRKSLTANRVEIDLTRQVLFVVRANAVQWTIPIASGREGWRTPTGTFSIQRKLPYWRESYLGLLYKPAYFHGGYAIHGSPSVPPYPASHGCVRVAVGTMDDLYPLLPIGLRVDIYY